MLYEVEPIGKVLTAILVERPRRMPALVIEGVDAEELDGAGLDEVGERRDHAVVLPAHA